MEPELREQVESLADLLLKCSSNLHLIDTEETLLKQSPHLSKRELKSNLKQRIVSSKIQMLDQLIENLRSGSGKIIVCSHYPHMIVLLKKYFKDSGVACFMYQPSSSIDSVYRFNLYSGQAVFLFQLDQSWTREEFTHFDLDFIQNIVIFDNKGNIESDIMRVFRVS